MAREVDRLREQAKRLQRSVGKKVSRLRRIKGVTETDAIDPRITRGQIDRMNSIQLRAHISRLARFQDRSNQFVGDFRGRPIPQSEWQQYKRAEKAVNARRQAFLDRIADIRIPTGQTTLGVMNSLYGVDSSKRHLPTDASQMPIHRQPRQMMSREAVKKLTKNLQKELDTKTRKQKLAKWRSEAVKMAESTGDKISADRLKGLDDVSFELLWVGTANQFVNALAHIYEMLRNAATKNISYIDSMMDDRTSQVNDYLDWVESPEVRGYIY